MNKKVENYITQKVAGGSYKAYVPPPLPPDPPVDLAKIYPCLEKATLALAELDSLYKSIPNTSLFI